MNERPNHQVIDEDGTPLIDATGAAGPRTEAGSDDARQGADGRSAYIGGMPGMPGMPGMQIPEKFLGKDGKPSLWKMIGWRGALAIALVIGVLVTLAIISAAFLLIAIPVLAVIALGGWIARKLTGRSTPHGSAPGARVMVVRTQVPPR
ncbi:hypothetical protein EK0264_02900 [Epidermidibacterium keratini]|uniref:Uncharacterized protein n=1 Tax=Epidermidibacterium keratini TaxID=1891644 RepID=A0A7L4YJA9_9ACTN|nr:hypothetical protein [Epidermidibacterium keratini]QHB99335.1 hypothetical protein EK0264_02900 [Epidermidibacterium keratini]